jgi:hypothetical protein
MLVSIHGVVQDPSTYAVNGNILTFSSAPPTGTGNISCRYLGIPASGINTTAYRTVTDFTATLGQTTFSVPSYTVGYIDVYRNGVKLAQADYSATNGTTVVLNNACSVNDLVQTVSFYVSSVLNAIQQYNGNSVNQTLVTPTINSLASASGSNLTLQSNASTSTYILLDTNGNVGVGVTPPTISTNRRALVIGGAVVASVYHYAGIGESAYNWYVDGSASVKYATTNYAGTFEFNNSSTGGFAWKLAPSGTAGSAVSFTQAMTLNTSGVLSVGTTNAYGRLTVNGSVQNATQATYSSVGNTDGSMIKYYVNDVRDASGGSTNRVTAFYAYSSDESGSPAQTMYYARQNNYYGQTNINYDSWVHYHGSGTYHYRAYSEVESKDTWSVKPSTTIDTVTGTTADMYLSGNFLIGYTTSNGSYKLQVNSQIFATSSSIATSDERYKQNIQPLSNALALVNTLNPVSFDWKSHPVHAFDTSTTTVGFIAQEVQQALAGLPYVNSVIKSNSCTIEPEEKDPEGNVTKSAVEEEFLGIAETNMIPLLTKAIQELTAQVKELQAKVGI